ncbi:MAG: F0F1 ATP synthase subunit delta [Methylacidiphilales bacterium]|nr:F0F1 ATP synthase subunit delta [Candidatus Methylacidiphilales bacterium]
MKINREARAAARKWFAFCHAGGRLDENRMREVVKQIAALRPRNHRAILLGIYKLVELDERRRTALVESAVPLEAEEAELRNRLLARFGDDLKIEVVSNPALLGGLRIQVGSDLWDGSVQGRLDALQRSF